MFDPFDKFGALNRSTSEEDVASLSDEARPKYIALVSAALAVEDAEAKLKSDTQALYDAADAARLSRETLESIVPKLSFHDCWKAVMERPKEY
jgi:hypothetical protein